MPSKQKINKGTICQIDLTDAYILFHPTETKYVFFLEAHGVLSKIDYTVGRKASLIKYKITEIISSILSENSAIKLCINSMKNYSKHTNTWKMKNTLLND